MHVRRGVLGDADGIGEVHAAAWLAAYGDVFDEPFLSQAAESRRVGWRGSLERLLVAPSLVLVAEREAAIVGFSHSGPSAAGQELAEIYAFYCHPSVWGSGIASDLMVATCSVLADRWNEVRLWTLRDAGRARSFYEKSHLRLTGAQRSETLTDWTTGEAAVRPAVEFSKVLGSDAQKHAPER